MEIYYRKVTGSIRQYFSFTSVYEANPYQRSEGYFSFLLFAACLSEFLGCIRVQLMNGVTIDCVCTQIADTNSVLAHESKKISMVSSAPGRHRHSELRSHVC